MKKTNKASGLIFAVILLFVILAIVVTLSSITVLETKMGQKTKSSVGAFYNSESGVEWALNKIATGSGKNIRSIFGSSFDAATGKVACPAGFGCELYLLDDQGHVIFENTAIDEVKAVRSIGTQGGETARAIEAAVAAGSGSVYVKCQTRTGNTPSYPTCAAGWNSLEQYVSSHIVWQKGDIMGWTGSFPVDISGNSDWPTGYSSGSEANLACTVCQKN
ncbi:MAG TPA: pilus assembly PilX N-terminal domain-containing protein [Candidatus Bathyarchaeia archaeon]|nr:pilus assembly PilX N-terminal domain-containing protein [Candidatus Bathyarchaeia archaeon]